MSSPEPFDFVALCLTSLGEFLSSYGYVFEETHYRPKGVAIEFSKGPHRLFAACEGSVVDLEIIVCVDEDVCYRVSLNQAFWFRGIRSLAHGHSCSEQVDAFIKQASACCDDLLSGQQLTMDPRYCFEMSRTQCQEHVQAQRGS
ncbi:MAG: hypothetical protein ISR77_04975 [Pirellulaceae bacterium]|nr:hypothetical protein [Pirellulaceae bacterium]